MGLLNTEYEVLAHSTSDIENHQNLLMWIGKGHTAWIHRYITPINNNVLVSWEELDVYEDQYQLRNW